MPNFHRLKKAMVNGWSWALDYGYGAYLEAHSFFSRKPAAKYLAPATKHPQRTTILLLPGIYETWRFMKPVANMLLRAGYVVRVVEGLGYNVGDIEKMAEIVSEYIDANHLNECVIVAHSKGGLVGKYVLANFNSKGVVKGMIALNTPFGGSVYASLVPLRAVRMFRPDSPSIATLTEHTDVNNKIVSIYGLFDPHIPEGSFLEGAHNVQLKTRGHFRSMYSREVHAEILKQLQRFETAT